MSADTSIEQAAKIIAHYLQGEDVAHAVVDSLINLRDAALAERNRATEAAAEWKMRWQQAAEAALRAHVAELEGGQQ